jgi:hypothetical protein
MQIYAYGLGLANMEFAHPKCRRRCVLPCPGSTRIKVFYTVMLQTAGVGLQARPSREFSSEWQVAHDDYAVHMPVSPLRRTTATDRLAKAGGTLRIFPLAAAHQVFQFVSGCHKSEWASRSVDLE